MIIFTNNFYLLSNINMPKWIYRYIYKYIYMFAYINIQISIYLQFLSDLNMFKIQQFFSSPFWKMISKKEIILLQKTTNLQRTIHVSWCNAQRVKHVISWKMVQQYADVYSTARRSWNLFAPSFVFLFFLKWARWWCWYQYHWIILISRSLAIRR